MSGSQKATHANITIGPIQIDGFMLPGGSYRMSQTQVAETVEKGKSNTRKFLTSKAVKGLLDEDYTPGKNDGINIEPEPGKRGQSRIKPLTIDEVSAFWLWET